MSSLRQSQVQFHSHILNNPILQLQPLLENRNMFSKHGYFHHVHLKPQVNKDPRRWQDDTWHGGVDLIGWGVCPQWSLRWLTDNGLCSELEGVWGGTTSAGSLHGVEVSSWVPLDLAGRCDLVFGVKKRSALLNVDIVVREWWLIWGSKVYYRRILSKKVYRQMF